uniref:Peptidase S1 domain-containing protein n=1 Tax=Caenorhabditis tropicalis TaxID=1561998 RepID=A0A1I7TU43_9PELO
MGTEVKPSKAPWAVQYFHLGKHYAACSGTIISSRHILTATHCVQGAMKNIPAEHLIGTDIWQMGGRKPMDRSIVRYRTYCKNGHYIVTDPDILEPMEIQSNYSRISISPERITLFYACSGRIPDKTRDKNPYPSSYTDDFAIIHLKEDLKLSDTVQIACVAEDISANAVGTMLDYYGYGSNPPKNVHSVNVTWDTYKLRHETIQVHIGNVLEDYYFSAKDPKNKMIACPGDSGGGSVATINGRITVVGVLCRGSCHDPDTRENAKIEEYAAVGWYSDVICEDTGICKISSRFNLFLLFVWITLGIYFK